MNKIDKANNGETRGEMITGEIWTGIGGPGPISGPARSNSEDLVYKQR